MAESRLSPEGAEQWISRYEAEGALRGLDRRSDVFWRECWEWIADQRGLVEVVPVVGHSLGDFSADLIGATLLGPA